MNSRGDSMRVRGVVAVCFVVGVAIVLFMGVPSVCRAAEKGDSEADRYPQTLAGQISKYSSQGYKIIGPIPVRNVSEDFIIVGDAISQGTLSLVEKDVTVMDTNLQSIEFDQIKRGSRVRICTKGSQVIIFLYKDSNTLKRTGPDSQPAH